MDQFLSSIPRNLLAIILMVGTLLFLRQVQPPHTICDSQMDLFRAQQKRVLYAPEKVGEIQRPALIKEFIANCKRDNSPGGCFELFESLKKMSVDLGGLQDQCADHVDSEAQIKEALWGNLKLMAQLAWGEKMPMSQAAKYGWFDTSEIRLFCDLRGHIVRFYGIEHYNEQLRGEQGTLRATMMSLPKTEGQTFEAIWPKTIFATNCQLYR